MSREDREFFTHLFQELKTIMSALDTSTSNLAAAVTANTTATNDLITAFQAAEPTAAQLAAIDAQTTAVEANTTAINNALTPPAPAPAPPAGTATTEPPAAT